jgi:hypothetical protein
VRTLYSTLLLLLIASLTALAVATAALPDEPIGPTPAPRLALPVAITPAS